MELTNEFKKRIITEINARGDEFSSSAKQANYLGISAAQLSRIKKGETEKVISNGKWISMARRLNVRQNSRLKWVTAKTDAFNFISEQLAYCQDLSVSGILCDMCDLGKTHTAKYYAKNNRNVAYIDCSQVKSKQLFVREIAREFGISSTGRYVDVYQDLVFYLQSIEKPLVILDEAGDLKPDAFLELKALWNATERACGWYMLGADGLKHKIEKGRDLFKVGYAEIIRRYGSRFQRVSPNGKEASDEFRMKQFALVARANGLEPSNKLWAQTNGSLERVRIEVEKKQRMNASN